MADRYIDTATVSDEHGKGVEILRQQICNAHTSATGARCLMVAEVDMVLRRVWIVNEHSANITAGTANLVTRNAGSTPGTTSAVIVGHNFATTNLDSRGMIELDPGGAKIKRGRAVWIDYANIAPASAPRVVILGWMPDMFSLEANPRSYGI